MHASHGMSFKLPESMGQACETVYDTCRPMCLNSCTDLTLKLIWLHARGVKGPVSDGPRHCTVPVTGGCVCLQPE